MAGLAVGQRSVTTTRSAQTGRRLDTRAHLGLGLDHRVAAYARRRRHRGLAAAPQHLRCRTGHHASLHLVHVRQHHFEESRERLLSDLNTARMLRAN
jgi:hypothetical protein